MVSTDERPGLRERKKQRTHDDLQAAAIRLFAERGFHDVTIEEIAASVDVSPRTFYRYYSSKEDLVLGNVPDLVEAIGSALELRPRSEPVMSSIRAVTMQLADEYASDAEANRVRTSIIAASPELQQRSAERQPLMESVLVPFVADRLGVDGDDLLPRLIVSCTVAVSRVATDVWSSHGSQGSLADHIDQALAMLEAGFDTGFTPDH